MRESLPDDVPPIEETSHLRLLDLPAQLCFYAGSQKCSVESNAEQPIVGASRQQLRKLLATNIKVVWNMTVSQTVQDADGVTLRFANGTSVRGKVLVGADGSNSFGKYAFETEDSNDVD